MVHYAPFEQSQHNVVIYFDVHSLCSLYYVEYLVCTSILLVLNKFTCPFKKKKKRLDGPSLNSGHRDWGMIVTSRDANYDAEPHPPARPIHSHHPKTQRQTHCTRLKQPKKERNPPRHRAFLPDKERFTLKVGFNFRAYSRISCLPHLKRTFR